MFRQDDGETPFGQGDIVLVPQAHLSTAAEIPAGAEDALERPHSGDPVGLRRLLWREEQPAWETWAHLTHGPAMILTADCAIDKDIHRLARVLREEMGVEPDQAEQQAQSRADMLVQVAAIRCVADLPDHQQRDAGAVGTLKLKTFPGAPRDEGPYVIDFSRATTISLRAVDLRVASADVGFKYKLQAALCRYFAARNIEITRILSELFRQPVKDVESLQPPTGANPSTMRVRLHFEDGQTAAVDATYRMERLQEDAPATAPLYQRRAIAGACR